MSQTFQRILYDQCHSNYLSDEVDGYFMILSDGRPPSPYGPLTLHPESIRLERAITTSHIKQLRDRGKNAILLDECKYLDGLLSVAESHTLDKIVVMAPSEPQFHRTLYDLSVCLSKVGIVLEIMPNAQFFIDHNVFCTKREKPPVMETFYRWMRKQTGILMSDGKPLGGKWNFDKENRKFAKDHSPSFRWTSADGGLYPTNRSEAKDLLDYFVVHHLDLFGALEDAMYHHDDYVYHSGLSAAINFGLLTPMEVVAAVEQADSAMNNKEGFIRQVLGWREYMYHWFWYYHESLYEVNVLDHTRDLPDWFRWPDDSPLDMYCINHTLEHVRATGYGHHITRLMIIGNFCLLMGYNPHHVNKWFWEMYVDAFEWVVSPNVLGMSQFADGGKLATKPYVSSANYINKMSDYCVHCRYDPKKKVGEDACPFNYLYRTFIDKQRDFFRRQPFIVKNLERIDIEMMKNQTETFIHSLENEKVS